MFLERLWHQQVTGSLSHFEIRQLNYATHSPTIQVVLWKATISTSSLWGWDTKTQSPAFLFRMKKLVLSADTDVPSYPTRYPPFQKLHPINAFLYPPTEGWVSRMVTQIWRIYKDENSPEFLKAEGKTKTTKQNKVPNSSLGDKQVWVYLYLRSVSVRLQKC